MRTFWMWACISIASSATQSAGLTEQQMWDQYFGPVTPAEKEVFPDWKSERRTQFKLIKGSEAISITEKQISDPQWYSRDMQQRAERMKNEAALAKIPIPEPRKLHTAQARLVIDKIKAAYAKLDNYHENVIVWNFVPGREHEPRRNPIVYEGELWFSRTRGARGRVVVNRNWGRSQSDWWTESGCLLELRRDRETLQSDRFELNKSCDPMDRVSGSPLSRYTYGIEHQGLTAPLILTGDFQLPQMNSRFECSIPPHRADILLCILPISDGSHSTTIIQYDPATFLIRNIRSDSNTRSIARYTLIDSTTRISAEDLHYEMPADAKSWMEKVRVEADTKRAEVDAYIKKAEAMAKAGVKPEDIPPMRKPGIRVPNSAAGPILAAMYAEMEPKRKERARQCNAGASGQIAYDPRQRDAIDPETGKAWSKIYEDCRLQMTPLIVFQLPPEFEPCPDWIKTCEEQLRSPL
jgi:hypothetical protein